MLLKTRAISVRLTLTLHTFPLVTMTLHTFPLVTMSIIYFPPPFRRSTNDGEFVGQRRRSLQVPREARHLFVQHAALLRQKAQGVSNYYM